MVKFCVLYFSLLMYLVGGGFKSVSSGFGQTSIGLESAWGGPNKKYEKKIMEIMGPSRNLPQLGILLLTLLDFLRTHRF